MLIEKKGKLDEQNLELQEAPERRNLKAISGLFLLSQKINLSLARWKDKHPKKIL